MCALADSALLSIIREINDGKVTSEVMEIIGKEKEKFLNLCAVSCSELDNIKEKVDHRIKERTAFQRYKTNLTNLCLEIESLNVPVEGRLIIDHFRH